MQGRQLGVWTSLGFERLGVAASESGRSGRPTTVGRICLGFRWSLGQFEVGQGVVVQAGEGFRKARCQRPQVPFGSRATSRWA